MKGFQELAAGQATAHPNQRSMYRLEQRQLEAYLAADSQRHRRHQACAAGSDIGDDDEVDPTQVIAGRKGEPASLPPIPGG
jgi:hypothetical protein